MTASPESLFQQQNKTLRAPRLFVMPKREHHAEARRAKRGESSGSTLFRFYLAGGLLDGPEVPGKPDGEAKFFPQILMTRRCDLTPLKIGPP